MIFRQMFDAGSGTYSYLLASRRGGEALIIDPMLEKVGRYIELLNETRPSASQSNRYASPCGPRQRTSVPFESVRSASP